MFKLLKNISVNYIMMVAVAFATALVLFSGLRMDSGISSEQEARGYTVKDAQGTELRFSSKPQRIASLSVSADEMLLALVGPQRLLAVSHWSDSAAVSCIAEEVKSIPHRAQSSNGEAILALQADLIVVPDYTRTEVIATLRQAGAKVFVCPTPHKIQQVKDTLRLLGRVVGEEARAENIINNMDSRLQRIAQQVAAVPEDKRVEVLRLQENGAYYAPDTSFMEVCRLAGAQDATERLHYDYSCTLSQEEIVLLNPGAFVLEDWNYDGRHDPQLLKEQILANDAYSTTKAWQQRKIVLIPANHLLTVSHHMVAAVEDLAQALYPEYIKK